MNYVFTPKHHGARGTDATWLPALTFEEEFAIFDRADGLVVDPVMDNEQVCDDDGNLYGYERVDGGSLREIGTWHQQLAEFPVQVDGAVWHGYPIWPISAEAPQRLQGQRCRPHTHVFDRMLELGHINKGQRKRLMKGDSI